MMPDRNGNALGEFPHGANVVEYSYPLRADCTIYMRLPKDLRLNEARRIARMETLVDVEATSGFDPTERPGIGVTRGAAEEPQ